MATMKAPRAGSGTVTPTRDEMEQLEQLAARNASAGRWAVVVAAFRLGLRIGVQRELNRQADTSEKETRAIGIRETIRRGNTARSSQKSAPSWRQKLDSGDVLNIRALLSAGIRRCIIARKFNISTFTVTDIALGRTWKER